MKGDYYGDGNRYRGLESDKRKLDFSVNGAVTIKVVVDQYLSKRKCLK